MAIGLPDRAHGSGFMRRGQDDVKKIEAIIKPFKLDEAKEALH